MLLTLHVFPARPHGLFVLPIRNRHAVAQPRRSERNGRMPAHLVLRQNRGPHTLRLQTAMGGGVCVSHTPRWDTGEGTEPGSLRARV